MPECEICDEAEATLFCEECDQELCAADDAALHKPAKMASHKRKPIGAAAAAPTPAAAKPAPAAAAAPAAGGAGGGQLCNKCMSAPATAQCTDCEMILCSKCNIDIHKASHAKAHRRAPLGAAPPATPASKSATMPTPAKAAPTPAKPAPAAAAASDETCELCDENSATLTCGECDQVFCKDCDADMHKPAKMAGHKRTALGGGAAAAAPPPAAKPVAAPTQAKPAPAPAAAAASDETCELCDEEPATLTCGECDQVFCASCDADMHKPAKMQSHKRKALGGAAAAPAPQPMKAAPAPAPVQAAAPAAQSKPPPRQPTPQPEPEPEPVYQPPPPQQQPQPVQQQYTPPPQQQQYVEPQQYAAPPAQYQLAPAAAQHPPPQQQQQWQPPPAHPVYAPPPTQAYQPTTLPLTGADLSAVNHIVNAIHHKLASIEIKQQEFVDTVLSPVKPSSTSSTLALPSPMHSQQQQPPHQYSHQRRATLSELNEEELSSMLTTKIDSILHQRLSVSVNGTSMLPTPQSGMTPSHHNTIQVLPHPPTMPAGTPHPAQPMQPSPPSSTEDELPSRNGNSLTAEQAAVFKPSASRRHRHHHRRNDSEVTSDSLDTDVTSKPHSPSHRRRHRSKSHHRHHRHHRSKSRSNQQQQFSQSATYLPAMADQLTIDDSLSATQPLSMYNEQQLYVTPNHDVIVNVAASSQRFPQQMHSHSTGNLMHYASPAPQHTMQHRFSMSELNESLPDHAELGHSTRVAAAASKSRARSRSKGRSSVNSSSMRPSSKTRSKLSTGGRSGRVEAWVHSEKENSRQSNSSAHPSYNQDPIASIQQLDHRLRSSASHADKSQRTSRITPTADPSVSVIHPALPRPASAKLDANALVNQYRAEIGGELQKQQQREMKKQLKTYLKQQEAVMIQTLQRQHQQQQQQQAAMHALPSTHAYAPQAYHAPQPIAYHPQPPVHAVHNGYMTPPVHAIEADPYAASGYYAQPQPSHLAYSGRQSNSLPNLNKQQYAYGEPDNYAVADSHIYQQAPHHAQQHHRSYTTYVSPTHAQQVYAQPQPDMYYAPAASIGPSPPGSPSPYAYASAPAVHQPYPPQQQYVQPTHAYSPAPQPHYGTYYH